MTNKEKRELFIIIGIIVVIVNTVCGLIAIRSPKDRLDTLALMAGFDIMTFANIMIFILARKLFPENEKEDK